ncbi:uncharacterized protein LOC100175740 isoform X2 [Ciona intestinalis]
MDFSAAIFFLVLIGGTWCLQVSYTGPKRFPMNSDAVLSCQVDPAPSVPEDGDNLAVWWSLVDSAGARTKLGKSSVADSYLYNNFPNDLKDRFVMSTDNFDVGRADATIQSIRIVDDAQYQCEVENLTSHDADNVLFEVNVYNPPNVEINAMEINLDIRPIIQEEPTESSTENPMYDGTPAISEDPVEDTQTNVTIAQCVATFAYPRPQKFEFISEGTANVWTVVDGSDVKYDINDDGTYNVSAILRIDPTAELDGDTIFCKTWLYPDLEFGSTGTTPHIVVKHVTSEASIYIRNSVVEEGDSVTISCSANGNPAPMLELQDPSGNYHNVTGEDFIISRARMSDRGLYTCYAYTDDSTEPKAQDSASLDVKWIEKPQITSNGAVVSGQPIVVEFGGSLNVRCSAAGNPIPDIYIGKVNQETHSSSVTLDSVTYADAGTYSCSASKGGLEKTVTFQVVVNGGCKPVLQKYVSSSSQTGEGGYVKMICQSTGHPACAMNMDSYNDYSPTVVGQNKLELVIPDMQKQMTPLNFTCTASNAHGSGSATVILDDEFVCCIEPVTGGLGTGVVIIIILIVALLVVGLPLAVYCYKKKKSAKDQNAKDEKELEAGEGEKMAAADEDGMPSP